MAKRTVRKKDEAPEIIPPGATKQAADRDENPRGRPRHTPLDDRKATGDDPNVGLVGPFEDEQFDEENGPPYAGHAGGAVGGTPAEGRASGGEVQPSIAAHINTRNVDSTVGAEPSSGKRRAKKK
jgi:hypothetical protein